MSRIDLGSDPPEAYGTGAKQCQLLQHSDAVWQGDVYGYLAWFKVTAPEEGYYRMRYVNTSGSNISLAQELVPELDYDRTYRGSMSGCLTSDYYSKSEYLYSHPFYWEAGQTRWIPLRLNLPAGSQYLSRVQIYLEKIEEKDIHLYDFQFNTRYFNSYGGWLWEDDMLKVPYSWTPAELFKLNDRCLDFKYKVEGDSRLFGAGSERFSDLFGDNISGTMAEAQTGGGTRITMQILDAAGNALDILGTETLPEESDYRLVFSVFHGEDVTDSLVIPIQLRPRAIYLITNINLSISSDGQTVKNGETYTCYQYTRENLRDTTVDPNFEHYLTHSHSSGHESSLFYLESNHMGIYSNSPSYEGITFSLTSDTGETYSLPLEDTGLPVGKYTLAARTDRGRQEELYIHVLPDIPKYLHVCYQKNGTGEPIFVNNGRILQFDKNERSSLSISVGGEHTYGYLSEKDYGFTYDWKFEGIYAYSDRESVSKKPYLDLIVNDYPQAAFNPATDMHISADTKEMTFSAKEAGYYEFSVTLCKVPENDGTPQPTELSTYFIIERIGEAANSLENSYTYPTYSDDDDGECRHQSGPWHVDEEATVFEAGSRSRFCKICSEEEYQDIKRLKPTGKLSASTLPLQIEQSTTALKATGLAKGDYVENWKSSNTRIAKVSKKGKVTAKKKGSAVITAILASEKKLKAKVKVQTGKVKTVKIKLEKTKLILSRGKKHTLKPKVTPLTSQDKLSYTSSNKKVATVDKKGKITAKKKGTAKITIRSGKEKATCKITVK